MKIKPFTIFMVCLICMFYANLSHATELRLWSTETEKDRVQVINYLVDLFSALHPDVDVSFESIPENEIMERLKTLPDEEAPHIIHSIGNILASLGEMGHLDDQAASNLVNRLGRQDFFNGTLAMLSSPNGRGLVWGIPFHGWSQGIWYRKDWFDQANLSSPENWDIILEAAEKFHNPERGQYGILLGTGEDTYAEQVFHHIAMSNGVRFFDDAGRLAFGGPETIEALEFIVKLSEFTPPDATGWRGRDYFFQNRLGMMFYSTFIMDDLAIPSIAADSLGKANFASLTGSTFDPELLQNTKFQDTILNKQRAVFGQISGLGLTKGIPAEIEPLAERFVRFLFDKENYITWLHMAPGGMLPVKRGIAGSETFLRDTKRVFTRYGRQRVAQINSGLELVSSLNVLQGEQRRLASKIFREGILRKMVHRAVHHDVSIEKAVKEAVDEIMELMDE